MQNFYVYIPYNKEHDKFYIGQTNDLKRRELEHCSGFSVYTSKYDGDWTICHKEEFKSRSVAMRRELFLKRQKSKTFYRKLCHL